ncbi:helix-turn-helix domain-containing protein [Promicromonospora kroppenstedtii]|uniref:Helix-turn-helix domain-containing protein n=1 Tax=Promicromonospora kroppenstedtii TaxID=440482 RepID=A0ABW7XIM6_9MICO
MRVASAADVGALLREGRTRQGMTQAQLADAVGTSRAWVVAVESGSPNARLDLVLRALQWVDLVVDVSPDEASAQLDRLIGDGDG